MLPADIGEHRPTLRGRGLADLFTTFTEGRAWTRQAACRGMNPTVFFPEHKGDWRRAAEAKAVCAGCVVRVECLDDALSAGRLGAHGVWGGTTPKERRRLRKRHVA